MRESEEVALPSGMALLTLGVALGAAAVWVATQSGQKVRLDWQARSGDWKAQFSETLARSREQIIRAIESAQRGA